MNSSETVSKILGAFVLAQGDLPEVPRTKTATVPTKSGGSYSYTYADLADIIAAVRPVLAKHGLAFFQAVHGGDGTVSVTTTLLHNSGEWIASDALSMPAGNTAQSTGSAITYAKRYSLSAALGLVTDEDDDGASAGERRPRQRPAQKAQPPATPGEGASAFDSPMGFGKYKDQTWRYMTEGSLGGARHGYLEWLVEHMDDPAIVERAQKCLAIYSKRADAEAAQEG